MEIYDTCINSSTKRGLLRIIFIIVVIWRDAFFMQPKNELFVRFQRSLCDFRKVILDAY